MWIVNISFYLFALIALGIVLFALFQLGTVFWLAERLLDSLQQLQCKREARNLARRALADEEAAIEAEPIRQR